MKRNVADNNNSKFRSDICYKYVAVLISRTSRTKNLLIKQTTVES